MNNLKTISVISLITELIYALIVAKIKNLPLRLFFPNNSILLLVIILNDIIKTSKI